MPQTSGDPIRGRRDGNPRDARGALEAFYHAFNRRDLEGLSESWEQADTSVMSNPLGGVCRGWRDIRALYVGLVSGDAQVGVEFHDYTIDEVGDVFWAVGRERGVLTAPGGILDLAFRTTRIFRRSEDVWRQTHHHGSIEDPVLLQRYRQLVLGTDTVQSP